MLTCDSDDNTLARGLEDGLIAVIFTRRMKRLDEGHREEGGDRHCDKVGYGRDVEYCLYAIENSGEDEDQGCEAYDVAHHRGYYCVYRLAYRLEEYRIHLYHTADGYERHKDAERLSTELPICLGVGDIAGRTEYADNKVGRQLKECGEYHADKYRTAQYLLVQLLDSVILLCAHIEADNGLTAKYDTYHEVDNDGEYLALDTDDSDGNICAVLRESAVCRKLHVAEDSNHNDSKLGEEGGDTELYYLAYGIHSGYKALFSELEGLGVEEVDECDDEGHALTDNGSESGTRHTHIHSKDEDGVEDEVGYSAREH